LRAVGRQRLQTTKPEDIKEEDGDKDKFGGAKFDAPNPEDDLLFSNEQAKSL